MNSSFCPELIQNIWKKAEVSFTELWMEKMAAADELGD